MAAEIPAAAVQAAAEVLFGHWKREVPAGGSITTADDFTGEAREVLAAALPHLATEPAMAFHVRVTERSRDGYTFPNWDRATPLVVHAATKADALKKCWAVMGDCPGGRHWTWTAKVDKVAEIGVDHA